MVKQMQKIKPNEINLIVFTEAPRARAKFVKDYEKKIAEDDISVVNHTIRQLVDRAGQVYRYVVINSMSDAYRFDGYRISTIQYVDHVPQAEVLDYLRARKAVPA